jgi:hypothetical protein
VRFAPLWIFALALPSLHAATVTTQLDRDTIVVGDTATLQVRIENGNPQSQPVFQAPPNVSIQFAGQGSQYSIVNGQTSSAIILSYAVTATQPGTYTIPATSVAVSGATLMTQPLRLVVTKDEASAGAAGTGPAFIRLQAAKTNVYVGEMIPIEIKVYGMLVDELQVPTLKSEGFVIGTQAPGVRGREQVGNNIYNVYTFQMTVAAAKAGTLSLGPAEAQMIIRVPMQARRRTGDIFDEMFGGAFQRRQITPQSETVAMNVMPLPTQNRPATFNGAVGNFQLTATAAPTNVSVGDPITMQIQIQGRGSFDSVKLPDFGWKDFTFYQPNASVTNADALGTRGTKYFDQVVVPQRAGIAAIPSIVFSYFDPDARAYRTISKPPIPITVKATGHGQAQPTIVANSSSQPERPTTVTDIVHIKPTIGHLSMIGTPVAARPWFIAVQLFPVALWAAAVGWRRRHDRMANDPRLRREREVAKTIANLLPKLREHAAAKRSEEFFATTFRLLQEQIGERIDLPAAAITEAVVDEKLPKFGASTELLQTLNRLFQACNQARYAGATVAGMEALIPQIEGALEDIRKLPYAGGPK